MGPLIQLKDLDFLLYQVFNAEQLTEFPRYQDHDRSSFNSILDTAHGIALDFFAPHNAKADHHEPTFDGKKVKTKKELAVAAKESAQAKLAKLGLSADEIKALIG